MLYHLALYLQPYWSFFNVIHYISFRSSAALLSSLFFSLWWGDRFIQHSQRLFRSKAREWTPERHKEKDDMPTMGGLFVIGIIVLNSLLWNNLHQVQVWLFLFCLVGFGIIGCWDDWFKITKNQGISSSVKFMAQWGVAAIIAFALVYLDETDTTLIFPFFKDLMPDIGFLYIPWAMFVLVAMSNAVNLTDGLDGLAIGSLIPNFATFSLICYLAGHVKLAEYLHIPFAGTGEIAVIGGALVGASLGFLWYNTYPAQIFMGDVGSLGLGAALACMGLLSKHELLLVISGGLFVVETISVMVQVLSYRYWERKIFKMAPIHHHFELLGWPESKITTRFGIISLVLCLITLMTLKLR